MTGTLNLRFQAKNVCSKLNNQAEIQVLGHFFVAFTPWFPQIDTNGHETLPAMKINELCNAYVFKAFTQNLWP